MNKKFFSIVLYIVASLFGFVYLISEFIPNFYLSELGRLFLLCGNCFFLYFGGFLLSKFKSNNKYMKINLWIFFVLYIVLLITLTLFDYMWGRNGLNFINWFSDEFVYFIKHSINLIPFKTIIEFIKEFNSMYSSRTILLNLFGNFIALMPMAFFLPLLLNKQNRFKNFFITIILIVFGIELVQLLTASGRFDIDDFILNVSGATLMYFILKIKDVNKLIKNIFLLEKNKISKKSIISIIISILLVILGAIVIVKFRTKLYNDNYDEFNRLHNPQITIIDESEDICNEELDLFYEDDLYNYYFTCKKSDKVYADVEEDKKYLVKDFLKNETYNYDIKRMLQRLDYYNVDYIKENKYKYITFDVKVPTYSDGGYSSPNTYVNVANKSILDAKFDYYNADFDNDNNYIIDLHLIPIKSETTTINISFKDNDDNLLESYKYSVTIDNKLNVTFKEVGEKNK